MEEIFVRAKQSDSADQLIATNKSGTSKKFLKGSFVKNSFSHAILLLTIAACKQK